MTTDVRPKRGPEQEKHLAEPGAAHGEGRKGESQKAKDRKLPENDKEKLDRRLDEGSEESFPASDPVSVKITK